MNKCTKCEIYDNAVTMFGSDKMFCSFYENGKCIKQLLVDLQNRQVANLKKQLEFETDTNILNKKNNDIEFTIEINKLFSS